MVNLWVALLWSYVLMLYQKLQRIFELCVLAREVLAIKVLVFIELFQNLCVRVV
ncbi:hypothetical protein DOY81_005925, partial [Sarcophaga bullata]